jgi:hypothetical protein
LAVPDIEDIKAAPDYGIRYILIEQFTIGVVNGNFSISQSRRGL